VRPSTPSRLYRFDSMCESDSLQHSSACRATALRAPPAATGCAHWWAGGST
jgi:hypothetical protein